MNNIEETLVDTALRQMQESWLFKQPRLQTIKKYRRLYNGQTERRLRQQFNVPLPIFAGMIDTMQADLNDRLIVEYQYTDPADWKAVEKANAAIRQESESARPGAQWEDKLRSYRFEKILTGRCQAKLSFTNAGGYESNFSIVTFEDFFFEPLGGGWLENHLFAGEQNIWRTKSQLEAAAKSGLYSTEQVKKLVTGGGSINKMAGLWDSEIDISGRFRPLGLQPDSHTYVGEPVFNLAEWVLEYQGKRWYLLFEPYSGTWLRAEPNEQVCSADLFPWVSSASHKDAKNFASKSFADDLYPIADSVTTLFNQELTNRSKRNLNARAYDKGMFKNVQKLDEAQHRPDALVPVDTFNGTRRISEGIYAFDTPEIRGTVDLIDWLQRDTGEKLGVSEMQQGASQPVSKKVGVTYAELAQISKRVSFMSQPFVRMGQELGERFFTGLKDYMTEPLSIQLLGETGYEWDVLRRIDLNTKKNLEVKVSSQMQNSNAAEQDNAYFEKAMSMTAGSPNINPRVRDEMVLRRLGKLPEHEIALLLDTSADTDKETQAEVSAAIQDIVIRGKRPKTNYNADRYFVKRLIDFATRHRDTLTKQRFDLLMSYAEEHTAIAEQNLEEEARRDAREMEPLPPEAGGMPPTAVPASGLTPEPMTI